MIEVYRLNKSTRDENSSGVARKLGLYSPFQAMERKAFNQECHLEDMGASRKRKRKISSSVSSYLEPGILKTPTRTNQQTFPNTAIRKASSKIKKHGSDTASSSPLRLIREAAIPPLKPPKDYERRPRRKTKKDKYELKQGRKSETVRTKRNGPTIKKVKRKEKSGVALSHKFTAQNIASDRLTVSLLRVTLFS